MIWRQFTDEAVEARPAGKSLTVASYEAGSDITAYVESLAVGDRLPDAPLFLAPGRYVDVPLEDTYQTSWVETPALIRNRVEAPAQDADRTSNRP